MPRLDEIRASLVGVARRYSRLAHEVEDLAHDIILSALRRGSALDGETFLRSARGAARRHAALLARSAGRRRAREASCGADEDVAVEEVDARDHHEEGAALSELSPTLRTTLLLLVLGLDKAELGAALGVSDAALRKRFQALRERGPLARPQRRAPTRSDAVARLRRSQVALLPRLAAALPQQGPATRLLGVSDPDGHGLIFSEVLTAGRLAATPRASARCDAARRNGDPC